MLNWQSVFDWTAVKNNYRVYGARIGDEELFTETDDAASQAKYKSTRSETVRNTGLVSEYETSAAGTALVTRDKDVQQVLAASLQGLDSTYRLGTEVSVTSTWLNLSAVAYVVTRWSYDSESNTSNITLHPRASVSGGGIQPTNSLRLQGDRLLERSKTTPRDIYVPDPSSHTVS